MSLVFINDNLTGAVSQINPLLNESFTLIDIDLQQYTGSLWDSVDQRLLRKGLSVLKMNDLWQMWDLNLWIGTCEGTEKSLLREKPMFWQEFNAGAFQDTLKGELDLWSITKLADIQWVQKNVKVLNADEKQVAEIIFFEVDGQTYVKLRCLRGYEDELKVIETAVKHAGNTPVPQHWVNVFLYKKNISIFNEVSLTELLPTGEIPIRRAVSDMILNYLHTARFYEEGIINDIDTECLHTYRVSIRKIRSLLSIIKDIYPPEDWQMLKVEFKEFQQETNRLRDLDVFLMEEDNYKVLLPEKFRDLLEPLFKQAQTDREQTYIKVKELLSTESYKTKARNLESYFEQAYKIPPTVESRKTTKEVAQHHIKRIYRKMVKEIQLINVNTADEHIHELRIIGKKLRYLLEFFDPILDHSAQDKLLKALKKIQNDLGKFNDLSVQIASMTEKTETIPENDKEHLLPLGILIGVLYHQYQEQRNIVLESIQTFTTAKIKSYVNAITEV